jgi:hypothetical protein
MTYRDPGYEARFKRIEDKLAELDGQRKAESLADRYIGRWWWRTLESVSGELSGRFLGIGFGALLFVGAIALLSYCSHESAELNRRCLAVCQAHHERHLWTDDRAAGASTCVCADGPGTRAYSPVDGLERRGGW